MAVWGRYCRVPVSPCFLHNQAQPPPRLQHQPSLYRRSAAARYHTTSKTSLSLALRDASVAVGTAIPRRITCRGCGPLTTRSTPSSITWSCVGCRGSNTLVWTARAWQTCLSPRCHGGEGRPERLLTPCWAPCNHELEIVEYPCSVRALSAPRRRGARGVNSALTAP